MLHSNIFILIYLFSLSCSYYAGFILHRHHPPPNIMFTFHIIEVLVLTRVPMASFCLCHLTDLFQIIELSTIAECSHLQDLLYCIVL